MRIVLALLLAGGGLIGSLVPAQTEQVKKPHIIVIWGDDIGQSNISAYTNGLMGYRTPNIDSIAKQGMIFTDYYGEQSCTAGRASFITGQNGAAHGPDKSRLTGRGHRITKGRPDDCRASQSAGLRNRPIRQEPSGRQRRILADGSWLRRILRQPLSFERRGRARAS